jgi:hypothetical protein
MGSLDDGETFLLTLEPGLSTSLAMWVIPAFYPMKQVKCTGLVGSSLGISSSLLDFFLGRNP